MAGAGVSAGLLGIGGGMVQSPLMLEMGMLPEVQRATSATMILFTASSAALQFLAAGAFPGSLQYDYAIWGNWHRFGSSCDESFASQI
mmetsp:Transcript_11577/g.21219  ORF Transcript_11577/g.21219 Transcript_11577/m.21219 type:complete len:88 (-) Transcript_11577:213-476(-)